MSSSSMFWKDTGKGNVVSLRAQEDPNMYLVGFFYPAFHQQSASVLLVGNEPEIPDSEVLNTYWTDYFLKILKFPQTPRCVLLSNLTVVLLGKARKG